VGKNRRESKASATRREAGFSLIEVSILALLLLVAVGGLSGAVLSSMRLAQVTEESARADEAARALSARLQLEDFNSLFLRYNTSPDDDPGGSGLAPGGAFDVPGLSPRSDDADGRVGRIVFPVVDLGGGLVALRENADEPRLGMRADSGRDLNGNGTTDDDLTAGYTLLPARLILEWSGAGGARSYELDVVWVP
jgi:hypothetical protein